MFLQEVGEYMRCKANVITVSYVPWRVILRTLCHIGTLIDAPRCGPNFDGVSTSDRQLSKLS